MPNSTPKKRLLLFGASRGLGLAIAQEYLKRG
jgi:NAD(P)-dependent dehydrogenase (short-subunit alcohol dehydrogenase family)